MNIRTERVCKGSPSYNQTMKNMTMLILVNILTHGYVLLLSGRWWDDWCQYGQSAQELWAQALELGRPSVYYVVSFANCLPEGGYRIIVFLMFCLSSVFVYQVVKSMHILSERECLWISLLYTIIPANDCRVLLSVFSYSVGHFFYWLGFFVLTWEVNAKGKKRALLHVTAIFVFLLSFTLNSNLVFYGIVLLYIIFQKRSLQECVKYIDYLFAPVVFFLTKNIMFPPFGVYESYNSITLKSLIKAVVLVWGACFYVLGQIFRSLHVFYGLIAVVGCKIISKLCKKQKNNDSTEETYEKEHSFRFYAILVGIGFALLGIGLFPYVAIRENINILTDGVGGRDSMLSPLGASVILFALLGLLDRYRIKKALLFIVIISGIIFFNKQYLLYQIDYYRQLAFQQVLENEEKLDQTSNILFLEENEPSIQATRFYSLNANAEQVFHNQKRFIMDGMSDMQKMYDSTMLKMFAERDYHMAEYDIGDHIIDAIIKFDCEIGFKDAFLMRLMELHGQDYELYSWLKEKTKAEIIFEGITEYLEILGRDN